MTKCSVKGCERLGTAVTYYGFDVCEKHWSEHCNPHKRFSLTKHFKKELGGE